MWKELYLVKGSKLRTSLKVLTEHIAVEDIDQALVVTKKLFNNVVSVTYVCRVYVAKEEES